MNYKFLSTLAFVVCIYRDVKADAVPKVVEKPQVASSILKIGYVDVAFVLENLPEAKKNSAEIQSFEKQLENQLRMKVNELQEKYEAFQQQHDTFTEAQKKNKISEINKLQQDVQGLEQQKHAKMAEKYRTVMQPLHDKMQEVINKLAVEHGYTYILNKNTDAGPVILFAQQSFDISQLVLEKLKAMTPKAVVQQPVVGSSAQPKISPAQPKPVKKK